MIGVYVGQEVGPVDNEEKTAGHTDWLQELDFVLLFSSHPSCQTAIIKTVLDAGIFPSTWRHHFAGDNRRILKVLSRNNTNKDPGS